jgi:hypothetical protein
MSDWQWKIGEAIERIRSRYEYIGRKTGAPFLAIVYPPEIETIFFKEWHTQTKVLKPDIDIKTVNLLDITQNILSDIGTQNIIDSFSDPMPGSNPQSELGDLWIKSITEKIHDIILSGSGNCSASGKMVICLEKIAALYPAAGPRDIMHHLWDSGKSIPDCPVIVIIPGTLLGSRNYSFLNKKDEFMYRGDLL